MSVALVATALATPSDEITRAVSAGGAASVKEAKPDQFVKAFSAVLIRVKSKEIPAYVSAAVKVRPDLAAQITVAALRVAPKWDGKVVFDKQMPCDSIIAIVQAAIAGAPDQRESILRAAAAFDPTVRDCLADIPGEGPGSHVLNTGNNLGTINPGNTGGVVTSEEQPPGP